MKAALLVGMKRLLPFLLATIILTGCPALENGNTSRSVDQISQSRPSTGSEGIPGYIVKPGLIAVTEEPDRTITISAPVGTVSNGTADSSDVLVSIYHPIENELRNFLAVTGFASMRADFLEGQYAAADGSFSLSLSVLPRKLLMIAIDQEPNLNQVLVSNVRDFQRPTYLVLVRQQDGTYRSLNLLIQEAVDSFAVDLCSRPLVKPFCDAVRNAR